MNHVSKNVTIPKAAHGKIKSWKKLKKNISDKGNSSTSHLLHYTERARQYFPQLVYFILDLNGFLYIIMNENSKRRKTLTSEKKRLIIIAFRTTGINRCIDPFEESVNIELINSKIIKTTLIVVG